MMSLQYLVRTFRRRIVLSGCRSLCWPLIAGLCIPTLAHGAERVTLQSGFDLLCDHRVGDGTTTRLFLDGGSANYIEVETAAIVSDERVADAGRPDAAAFHAPAPGRTGEVRTDKERTGEVLTPAELHEVLQGAGAAHDLDVDLLASVVHAESGSRVHARSRAGAEGLMQLMPGTAATLGVHDAFSPRENVGGGATYLDALLCRYHGNVAWALAAYNAGPGAVDRWHGVPPYRETRAYVARIVHEFNGRYAARLAVHEAPLPRAGQPKGDAARTGLQADRHGKGSGSAEFPAGNMQGNQSEASNLQAHSGDRLPNNHVQAASSREDQLPLENTGRHFAEAHPAEQQTAATAGFPVPQASFEGERPR